MGHTKSPRAFLQLLIIRMRVDKELRDLGFLPLNPARHALPLYSRIRIHSVPAD